jgi:hypothetical protein
MRAGGSEGEDALRTADRHGAVNPRETITAGTCDGRDDNAAGSHFSL